MKKREQPFRVSDTENSAVIDTKADRETAREIELDKNAVVGVNTLLTSQLPILLED